MADTSLRLALFLVCVSAKSVSSQEVAATVSTTSLTLVWEKTGQWKDVTFFPVNIQVDGKDFCEATTVCLLSNICTFQSNRQCPLFSPCTNVVATVKGEAYTAPEVHVITAPSPVSDMKVKGLNHIKTITWTNPTSACFQNTTARVKYGDYLDYTVPLGHDDASLTVPVCMRGSGSVKVQARGGSGLSDVTSATLLQLLGSDAVRITACPPKGCKDVVVQWEYNSEICSGVTQYNVTLGGHDFTTTNISTTEITFSDLELNTQYDTCVSGLDKDNKLLARHCKKCTTYPEVVDKLSLVNVTNTTAEITWEPPVCPTTGGDMSYIVSYSREGTIHTNVTTYTSFLWTNLKPGVTYKFDVTVLHGNKPSSQSTSIKVFTMPAAPEEILVRVYEESSLFVTWPGWESKTPNIMYLVSWGDELEHSDYTDFQSYTIDGYDETMGPDLICVEVEVRQPKGVRSTQTCQESPFPNFKADKPDHTDMIVGVSVSACLAVALSAVLVVVSKTQERRA